MNRHNIDTILLSLFAASAVCLLVNIIIQAANHNRGAVVSWSIALVAMIVTLVTEISDRHSRRRH